jgi:hypothetical protein
VPDPCFLLFLCFRKATQEIFSELDKTKVKPSIFTEALHRPKMRRRGARGSPHPRVARARAWLRHQGVSHPSPPSDTALSPISSLDGKNLRDGSLFHETYCKPLPSPSWDQEDPGALPGTLWYVSNVSIIFYAPCLFLHHLLSVSLHFVAFLCIFRN